MSLHYTLAEGQAEADSPGLGGEKWLEDLSQPILGDAPTCIRKGNRYPSRTRGLGLDHQLATLGHSLDGVEHDICKNLTDLIRVTQHLRQGFIKLTHHLNVLRHSGTRQCILDEVVYFEPLPDPRLRSSKFQQAVNNSIRYCHFCLQNSQCLLHLWIRILQGHVEKIGSILDGPQRVAELVAHAAGQLPEHRQPLLARQLLLGIPQRLGACLHHLLQPL